MWAEIGFQIRSGKGWAMLIKIPRKKMNFDRLRPKLELGNYFDNRPGVAK